MATEWMQNYKPFTVQNNNKNADDFLKNGILPNNNIQNLAETASGKQTCNTILVYTMGTSE